MNANRLRREEAEEQRTLERTAAVYAGVQERVIAIASVHAPTVDAKPAPSLHV